MTFHLFCAVPCCRSTWLHSLHMSLKLKVFSSMKLIFPVVTYCSISFSSAAWTVHLHEILSYHKNSSKIKDLMDPGSQPPLAVGAYRCLSDCYQDFKRVTSVYFPVTIVMITATEKREDTKIKSRFLVFWTIFLAMNPPLPFLPQHRSPTRCRWINVSKATEQIKDWNGIRDCDY